MPQEAIYRVNGRAYPRQPSNAAAKLSAKRRYDLMASYLRSAVDLCVPRDRSLRLDILDALSLVENIGEELKTRPMSPELWETSAGSASTPSG